MLKEVSPLEAVCCFRFQECVYFQVLQELEHLLSKWPKALHPIAG